jgi:hypothetical protein
MHGVSRCISSDLPRLDAPRINKSKQVSSLEMSAIENQRCYDDVLVCIFACAGRTYVCSRWPLLRLHSQTCSVRRQQSRYTACEEYDTLYGHAGPCAAIATCARSTNVARRSSMRLSLARAELLCSAASRGCVLRQTSVLRASSTHLGRAVL